MDMLSSVELDRLGDDDILTYWWELERERRRVDHAETAVLAQIRDRGLPFAKGCKNTVDLARVALRIGPREARGRVALAEAVGPHRSVVGEPVGPIFPTVAAAFASGEITARAAATITQEIEKLPDEVQADHGSAVEETLVGFARQCDPELLAKHARDLRNMLDQDGAFREYDYRERMRGLSLRRRPDGSGTLSGEVTCQTAEVLQTMWGALTAPAPAEDGAPDRRTPAQRRHDGLLDGLNRLMGSGKLPSVGGCRTTVLLTMNVDDFARNAGTARTGYGVTLPVELTKRWLEPETRAIITLLSKARGIEAYSTPRRLFDEAARLAMAARDKGCSFPTCDVPAAWTQAHHLREHAKGGPTSVDNGALVCGRNHHEFERMGYQSIPINGRPHWIPPTWIDPKQTPVRNTLHDNPDLPAP